MLEMFLTISFNGRDQSCMCFWLAEHDIRFNTYQKKNKKKQGEPIQWSRHCPGTCPNFMCVFCPDFSDIPVQVIPTLLMIKSIVDPYWAKNKLKN